MKKVVNLPLYIVIFLAFVVRIMYLNNNPLFGDEIDVGLQANSLLHTLRDYRGNFFPAYLQSFSESRAPLLIYSTVPSIAIFGLTSFAVRLVPLIFGILSLIFLYKLVNQISKSNAIAFTSSIILAFTPWHIHYSRLAFELTLLIFLLLSATYYYQHKKVASAVLFSLTFYTYSTAVIFTPLIILYLLLVKPAKSSYKFLTALFIFLTPLTLYYLNGQASNRFSQISIFNDRQIINQIIQNRTDQSQKNQQISRIFHNKLESYSQAFIKNYVSAISPSFYFGYGDPNPRQQPPQTTLFLVPLIIPFIIGLHSSFSIFHYWLLTAPIASALTQGGGQHASRLFILIVPITYFVAVGLFKIRRNLRLPIFVLSIFSLGFYLYNYFTHYPYREYAAWQYGYDQLYSVAIKPSSRIFISNTNYESLPRFAFYQKIKPILLQTTSDHSVNNIFSDLTGFSLDNKTFFINDWNTNNTLDKISSIAQSGDYFFLLQLKDIPGDLNFTSTPITGFTTLKTVYYPNGLIMGQVINKN